jgi:hypothetical protein
MSKLLLDQAVSPPRLQAFAGLDNVPPLLVSLRGNELLCAADDSLARTRLTLLGRIGYQGRTERA